jgi:hypothetical protein
MNNFYNNLENKYDFIQNDIPLLKEYFNKESTKNILKSNNKRKIKILIFLLTIFYLIFLIIYFSDKYNIIPNKYLPIPITIIILVTIFIIKKFFKNNFKKELISNMLIHMYLNIDYFMKDQIFKYDEVNSYHKMWMIKKFSFINNINDCIVWNINTNWRDIQIKWWNIKTKISKNKSIYLFNNWWEEKVSSDNPITKFLLDISRDDDYELSSMYINNDFYITKIHFNNPKNNIKNDIKILWKSWNNFRSILIDKIKIKIILSIVFSILFIYSLTILNMHNLNDLMDNNNINHYIISLLIFFYTLFSFIHYLIYKIKIINKRKSRIKFNDELFEKKFDVYSKDINETKNILNKQIRDLFLNFSNRIDKKRKYKFYLEWNYIYIFINNNNLLNISSFSLSNKTYIKESIKFYIELKNLSIFTKKIEWLFFKKSTNNI